MFLVNDPRIPNVRQASDTPDATPAEFSGSQFRMLNPDGEFRNVYENIVAQEISADIFKSYLRPPAETDKVQDQTVSYWDSENRNLYLSIRGQDWQYQASKGLKDNVYIGNFTYQNDGNPINVSNFGTTETTISMGVTQFTPPDDTILLAEEYDIIFVGNKVFNVVSTAYTTDLWTITGTWADAYDGLTFNASESIYFTQTQIFIEETIWSGQLYRTQTEQYTQNLNAGKKFSDYPIVMFEIGGSEPFTLTTNSLRVGNKMLTNRDQYIRVRIVNDTQWAVVNGGGSGNINVTEIVGLKPR